MFRDDGAAMATLTTNKITRLTLEVQPPVARIRLKNPPLNVIDLAMMEELVEALGQIEARPVERDDDRSGPEELG